MSNDNMKVSSSPKVSKHVECLRHLQSQHDELEAQFLEERKALEAKYHKLYQPLYTKRYEIVNGLKEVDGVMSAELDSIKEDQATEEKGVPEFWLTAMKTHEVLAEEIKGQDEGALKFIKDIKWSRLQNPEGFELEFYFNPCPYFKNSVLTKTYHIIDESDPILSQAIGSEIEWYPEKCLTTKVVKRKQRMVSKKTKTTMTIKNCESFFTFFNPPQIPENEDDLDDDDYDELQDRLKQDYNLGIIIRDKIIPHAVSWFTGEAIEEDELDGIDYDGNDDDDEDEDKENDDGDEEDNESDKEVEQEEKRKQGVKKDIKKDSDEDEDEERKWGLKKDDDDDDDDDDEAGDEENDDGDEEDNESDKEAEQEEKRKQGVKKDIKKDYDEDEDEDGEKERKWDLKKDDDDEAEDDEYDDGDEEDNASDKKAEQEEKRKQGVKKDIKEDNDEDRDEEKERKWGLKKDVEDEDEEEEEEKQVWKKSSDGHKKIGGAQIQKGQQRELDHTCTQMTGAA